MKNVIWLFAFALTISVFTSCQKDPIDEPPVGMQAPDVPPAAMFTMPTDALEKSLSGDSKEDGEKGGFGYENWTHAAVNLVVWHTIVQIHMSIPTAAFGMALAENPEYIGDLTWLWDYTYEGPNHTYNVELTGQYMPDLEEVEWIMSVSQVGGFTDFVWYSGIVTADHTQGEIFLFHQPANPEAYLRINYANDEATGSGELRFTNVEPNSPEFGQYIVYRETPGSNFDRSFDVQGADDLLEIQWNEIERDGRVRHPQHFGDDEWHCWDTDYLDIDCQ